MAIDFRYYQPARPPEERFWEFVERRDVDACWLWQGALDKDGYGVFGFDSIVKTVRAHRFSWKATNGDPGKLLVLHECDVRPCVNPKHLFLGTNKDNSQDMSRKGRCRPGIQLHPELAARGEQHGMTSLTEKQVQDIKRRYRPRIVTLTNLAKEYDVAVGTVHNIVTGVTWGHVQP